MFYKPLIRMLNMTKRIGDVMQNYMMDYTKYCQKFVDDKYILWWKLQKTIWNYLDIEMIRFIVQTCNAQEKLI